MCRSGFTPVNKVVVAGKSTRSAVVSRVVCSAEKKEAVSQMGKAAAAAALSLAFGFSSVDAAFADVAGLTPCADSKAFAKRKKQEVKALNKRLKQYEAGSAPALALQATIEKTEKRFDTYAKQGLLCGTDGLPHLIADPGLALRYGHAGDVLVRFLFVFLLWCNRIASSAEREESIWVHTLFAHESFGLLCAVANCCIHLCGWMDWILRDQIRSGCQGSCQARAEGDHY